MNYKKEIFRLDSALKSEVIVLYASKFVYKELLNYLFLTDTEKIAKKYVLDFGDAVCLFECFTCDSDRNKLISKIEKYLHELKDLDFNALMHFVVNVNCIHDAHFSSSSQQEDLFEECIQNCMDKKYKNKKALYLFLIDFLVDDIIQMFVEAEINSDTYSLGAALNKCIEEQIEWESLKFTFDGDY